MYYTIDCIRYYSELEVSINWKKIDVTTRQGIFSAVTSILDLCNENRNGTEASQI